MQLNRNRLVDWRAGSGVGFLLVWLFLSLVVGPAGAQPVPDAVAPDLILHGGKVVTVNEAFDVAQAVAIRGDRFVAVGSNEEVRGLAGRSTELIDLGGRMVIPGLIDSHVHAFGYGFDELGVNFASSETFTIDEMLAKIGERAEETPPGEWIVARGPYSLEFIEEGRLPNRWEVDRVTPENPFYLNMQGHNTLVNSIALEKAGITKDTPEPEGGTIVRDSAGRPTGLLLEEPAFGPVRDLIPEPTSEDRVKAAKLFLEDARKFGITGLVDADGGLREMRDKIVVLHRLKEEGELTARWHLLYMFRGSEHGEKSYEQVAETVRDIGAPSGFGNDWITIEGIKLVLDGGVETAYMREPYAEDEFGEGYRGKLVGWDEPSLERVLRAASRNGMRMFVHVVGTAALDMALNSMEEIDRERSIADERWTLEHAGVGPTQANLEQARRLGIVMSTQQAMGWSIGKSFKRLWGDSLGSNWMPNKTYLDAGIVVKGGSDVAPLDPMIGLWSYVTRKDIDGEVSDPSERLTRREALELYTINGAYGTFDEDTRGSIEVGKLADLAVLSDDFLEVPEDEIRDIEVLMTVVGGEIVYRDGL